MPHIAITMYPGRDHAVKAALADKMQDTLIEELGVPKEAVSVSIMDIEKDNWYEEFEKIPKDTIFINSED